MSSSQLPEINPEQQRSDVPAGATSTAAGKQLSRQLKLLGIITVGLVLCFSVPLWDVIRLSLRSSLYSHIPLVPFISLYLAWLQRDRLARTLAPSSRLAFLFGGLGVVLMVTYGALALGGWKPIARDHLSIMTLAFLLFFWSACAITLGSALIRQLAFPLLFLIFAIPMPSIVEMGIETFLQYSSAEVSYILLKLAGTPVLRDGLLFKLPNITLAVAPECSGLRSSLVLFMTALLAAHLFLRKLWTKTTLAISVIVLGIIRNAIRIFIIAEMCVHVDPNFVDSALHHRGGPVFFAASLIPFFLLVWLLRKIEVREAAGPAR